MKIGQPIKNTRKQRRTETETSSMPKEKSYVIKHMPLAAVHLHELGCCPLCPCFIKD